MFCRKFIQINHNYWGLCTEMYFFFTTFVLNRTNFNGNSTQFNHTKGMSAQINCKLLEMCTHFTVDIGIEVQILPHTLESGINLNH